MKTKKGVLVTRPESQAVHLLEMIHESGAQPISFPLLKIDPLPFDQDAKQIVMNLDIYDVVIFTSANAVDIAMNWIESYWPQFPDIPGWLAVGKATARKLAEHGVSAVTPAREASEGLLALPELAEVEDKKILIVRGADGRELLKNHLVHKGANVQYLDVYRRQRVSRSKLELDQLRQRFDIRVLMITSGAALEIFDELVEDADFRSAITLVVPSERLEQLARNLGYTDCIRSAGADDASMLAACAEFIADK